jgi:hypothetical protein
MSSKIIWTEVWDIFYSKICIKLSQYNKSSEQCLIASIENIRTLVIEIVLIFQLKSFMPNKYIDVYLSLFLTVEKILFKLHCFIKDNNNTSILYIEFIALYNLYLLLLSIVNNSYKVQYLQDLDYKKANLENDLKIDKFTAEVDLIYDEIFLRFSLKSELDSCIKNIIWQNVSNKFIDQEQYIKELERILQFNDTESLIAKLDTISYFYTEKSINNLERFIQIDKRIEKNYK